MHKGVMSLCSDLLQLLCMNSFSFISSIAQQQSDTRDRTDCVRGHTGQVLSMPGEGWDTEKPCAWQVSPLFLTDGTELDFVAVQVVFNFEDHWVEKYT